MPEWYPNPPEVQGTQTVVSSGSGLAEALMLALRQAAEQVETQTMIEADGEVERLESVASVAWGRLRAYVKTVAERAPEASGNELYQSVTVLVISDENQSAEFSYFETAFGEEYRTRFESRQTGFSIGDVFSELERLGVEFGHDTRLAESFIMLRYPETAGPETAEASAMMQARAALLFQ